MDMLGSLRPRYATNAILATAGKTAMQGTPGVTKKAIPQLIAQENGRDTPKVATVRNVRGKKRNTVELDTKHSDEPQLKKPSVGTGGIDINAPGESILQLYETNATDENMKSC